MSQNPSNINNTEQKDTSVDSVMASGNSDSAEDFPPSKNVAFDIFKSEQGHEMYKTFQNNKGMLHPLFVALWF